MTPQRDDLLGTALRELEIPEHRPEFHRELRRRLRPERRPARRTRYGALLAAAALVAALAAVTLRHGGTPTAEAAVVQAKLRAALASFRNVSGELVASGTGQGKTVRMQFVLDARGNMRVVGPKAGDVLVVDSARLTFRSAQHSASMGGSTLFYAVRTGAPLGPPDDGGESATVLTSSFGGYVEAALATGNPAVKDVTYAGRPAWRLLISPQDTRVTIDKATGMAVEVDDLRHHRRLRILDLRVDRRLPAGTFSLRFPPGAEVSRFDSGFRRASVGQAPLAATWVPSGYRLLRVARDGDVWDFLYQRGFAQIVVTARRGAVDWSGWGTLPHAQVEHEGLTVTAAGAASPGDLARIVRSAR